MQDFNNINYAARLNECFGEEIFLDIESISDNNSTFTFTSNPVLESINIAPPPLGKSTSRTKRIRTCYTTQQLTVLENVFRKKEYLTLTEKDVLAAHLNLPRKNIKVWFQNRRQKKKKVQKKHESELPMLNSKEVELIFKALEAESEPIVSNIDLEIYLEIFNK